MGGVLALVVLVAVLALVIKRRRSRRGYQPPIEVELYAEQPRISKSYYVSPQFAQFVTRRAAHFLQSFGASLILEP